MFTCSVFHPAGRPQRPCRRTTAATRVSSWISLLLRWPRWIRRCLLFHLGIASGTCCWEIRRFRTMTGNVKESGKKTGCPRWGSSCRGSVSCATCAKQQLAQIQFESMVTVGEVTSWSVSLVFRVTGLFYKLFFLFELCHCSV